MRKGTAPGQFDYVRLMAEPDEPEAAEAEPDDHQLEAPTRQCLGDGVVRDHLESNSDWSTILKMSNKDVRRYYNEHFDEYERKCRRRH
jgi:hypothetical protein